MIAINERQFLNTRDFPDALAPHFCYLRDLQRSIIDHWQFRPRRGARIACGKRTNMSDHRIEVRILGDIFFI